MKKIGVVDLWHNYTLCYSWSMASILAKRFQVVYFANRDNKCSSARFQVVRLPVTWPEKTTLRTWLKMPFSILQAHRSRKMIQGYDLDALLFTFNHPLLGVLRPSKVLCVNTIHEYDNRQGFISFLNRVSFRLNQKRSDVIVVLNEQYEQALTHLPIPVVRHRHPLFETTLSDAPIVRTGKLRFLFFGTLRKDKGLAVLLKAFREIKQSGVEAVLTIAGRGDITPYAEAIAQLEDIVTVMNRYLSDMETIDLFNKADIVALPYNSESQSGVAMLAMTLGVPLLVSDLPGLKKLVRTDANGWVFKRGDADSLAEQIGHLEAAVSRVRAARGRISDYGEDVEEEIFKLINGLLNHEKRKLG